MDEHTEQQRHRWIDRAQIAGLASVGAGAIHLAAAGTHAEHPTVARLFVLLGAAQVAAGLWLAIAGRRPAAAVTIAVSVVAVGGWLTTRATGIGWIDGLDVPEDPAFADTVCAALGIVAIALGALVLGGGDRPAHRAGLVAPGVVVGGLAVAAMLTATSHVHGEGHAHAGEEATTAAFDPTDAIDLSGTPGVSPDQQAFAEDLVARTLADLPQWSDPVAAEAAGFHSIGDAPSGFEHYVQWTWIDDDVALDPNHPESLVYVPQPDGTKQLVSAMYMLPPSVTLDDVPDWGGPLMQWHVHDDLCFTADGTAPLVRGVTGADGTCHAPLVKLQEAPMIHVWITPHPCGPFAALEGIGAGTIEDGAERLCDHVHGS